MSHSEEQQDGAGPAVLRAPVPRFFGRRKSASGRRAAGIGAADIGAADIGAADIGAADIGEATSPAPRDRVGEANCIPRREANCVPGREADGGPAGAADSRGSIHDDR